MEEEFRSFAVLDCDNLVINCTNFPAVTEELPESILETNYSNRYRLLEYSDTPGITNNPATIGHFYNEELNAFIPRCPGEGYILNINPYFWYLPNDEMDPNQPVIPI